MTDSQTRLMTMFTIVEIGRRMTGPVELMWGDAGLSPSEGIVMARLLVNHGGLARSGELVRYPLRSTAAVARVLAGLEADGLITRRQRKDDRRGVDVEVTTSGRELFDSVVGRITAEAALPTAEPLSDDDLEALKALLDRLTPPDDG